MSWTKNKKPKQTQKTKNTPPRAHSLQRTSSVPKSLPGMSCHREHSTGTLASCPCGGTQTQRAKSLPCGQQGDTWDGSEPTVPLLPTTRLLLPCHGAGSSKSECSLLTSFQHQLPEDRSQGTTVQRHDPVLTGHSRQLLFLSQHFFSGGMQTALTGRFALSATEWGLLRPPEEGRRQVF